MKKVFPLIFPALFFVAWLSGCGTDNKFTHLTKTATDSAAEGIIIGARNQLANPATKKVIVHLLDSIISNLDSALEPKITSTMNRVFNQKVILWSDSLVEALTGKKLQNNVGILQYKLVGKTTKDILQIKAALQNLLEYALSDSTNHQVGLLRDQLLGPRTDSAITHLVDDASKRLIANIKKPTDDTTQKLTKEAIIIIVVIGVVALAIIFGIWWSRRKYINMVTLLTKEIHDIPDREVYDHVTQKIKDRAVAAGLEPNLRQILLSNGLIGGDAWSPKKSIRKTDGEEK